MERRGSLTLAVFVDAFGWELRNRYPFLEDVLPGRAPLETILGYSCTCDPTILTGRLPRDHGHFSFFSYAPQRSPFRLWRALQLLPDAVAGRARVRGWISRVVQRQLGFTGYFNLYQVPFRLLPLLDYTERRDIYQPGGINGGQQTFLDPLRRQGVPFHLADWRAPERQNLARLREVLERRSVRFAYLYLAALDGVLHRQGTRGAEVPRHIAWYDQQLRELIALAERRYAEVRVVVFSDHGMTDVDADVPLRPRIERLGLRYGVDYAAVYDSTMARFWFLREGAREAIERVLRAEPEGHTLSDAELAGYGCDFADRRYGELLFLMRPGALLVPSFMNARHVPGMHGYAPEHRDSVASFSYNFELPRPPRRLDDLHALLLAACDLPPAGAADAAAPHEPPR